MCPSHRQPHGSELLDSQRGASSGLVLAADCERRFYPDFVAKLADGRLLVVEYKGAHIANSPDTAEKRTIGTLWENASEGKGLFIVAENMVDGVDVRGQLIQKIGETSNVTASSCKRP